MTAPDPPEPPEPPEGFDPWTVPLPVLASKARFEQLVWRRPSESSEYLLQVLQARAVLDAARRSDRTAKRLVFATWALVLATLALVGVDLALRG